MVFRLEAKTSGREMQHSLITRLVIVHAPFTSAAGPASSFPSPSWDSQNPYLFGVRISSCAIRRDGPELCPVHHQPLAEVASSVARIAFLLNPSTGMGVNRCPSPTFPSASSSISLIRHPFPINRKRHGRCISGRDRYLEYLARRRTIRNLHAYFQEPFYSRSLPFF